MKAGRYGRYGRAILSLVAVLLVFLSLVDVVLVGHQYRMMQKELREDARNELAIMGTFAREALLRQDYALLEQFLNQWAEEHQEVTALRAIAPNGFVLVDYQRLPMPEHTFPVRHRIDLGENQVFTLTMAKDFTELELAFRDLTVQLALRSLLLAAILGLVLWYIFKNLVLRPLEKEIARRRDAENKFRTLLEGAPDAMVLVNLQGKIVLVNSQVENLFGHAREELLDRNVVILMAERRRARHLVYIRDYLAVPRVRALGMNFESLGLHRNGREFPVDISLRPLTADQETFILIDIRDITERKKAEAAIRESEEKFRTLVENVNFGIYRNTGGPQGEFLEANPAIVKMFGYDSTADFLKTPVSMLYRHPEERRQFIEEVTKKGFVKNREVLLRKKNGTPFWGSVTARVQFNRDGSIKWIDGVVEDITESKRSAEKIARGYLFQSTISQVLKISIEPISFDEQLDRILKLILAIPWLSFQSKGCIFLVEDDPDLLVMKARQGLSPAVQESCARLPVGKCLCGQAAEQCRTIFADCVNRQHKHQGEELPPHGQFCVPICRGQTIYGVLNVVLKERHPRDPHEEMFLTSIADTLAGVIEHRKSELEKERLQEQLAQTEKLSALGRMTATVAHEIRNPLTALGGLTRRLDQKIAEGSKEKEYTRIIVAEAMRLEKILSSVLSFTGRQPFPQERSNINPVIEDSLKLFAEVIDRKQLTVSKDLGETPPVKINREKMREVIDNLLTNAIDATPAGGRIRLASGTAMVQGAPYVLIAVSDTGKGISAGQLKKIFDPFFTTKGVGPRPGIGLGLSICKKIMEEHRGFMRVESTVGQGTTFNLYLPPGEEE